MLRKIFSSRGDTANREADDGPPPGSSHIAARSRGPRQPHSLQLMLADLRIGREPDHALVTIPVASRANVDPLRPPQDEQTAALRGKAYLEFLSTDVRLGSFFKAFIRGNRVLTDPQLTGEKAAALAEQFRPILAQAYHDPELLRKMETCALETTGYCSGRAQVFVGQMRDAALLSFVKSGQIDDVTLYNVGISFFRLHAVRAEVGKRSPIGGHAQNVHDYLDAEYFLQEELNLPTQHSVPDHPNQGFVNRQVAREIGNAVKARMAKNNGASVIEFMSTWAPWQDYVSTLPENRGAYEAVSKTYEEALELLQADRETSGSNAAALTEKQYLGDVDALAGRRADWINQYTGQKTFEFLATHKAEFLIDGGTMPRYFNRFTQ